MKVKIEKEAKYKDYNEVVWVHILPKYRKL